MGYDMYLIKTNKNKFEEKLKFTEFDNLSYEDIEEISEDDIDSYFNIFEDYFINNDISYRYDDYHIISKKEFDNMFNYLYFKVKTIVEECSDYEEKRIIYAYKKMQKWYADINNSVILFEHDC